MNPAKKSLRPGGNLKSKNVPRTQLKFKNGPLKKVSNNFSPRASYSLMQP
jgi:hypothetical protein